MKFMNNFDLNDPIGIAQLRAENPNANAEDCSLLQVEHLRNGAWSPSTTQVSQEEFYSVEGTVGKVSPHANLVLKEALDVAGKLGSIEASEASAYRGRNNLWEGYTFEPAYAGHDVECHAYGANHATGPTGCLARMDYRIQRDGPTVVVGVEKPSGNTPLWLWARALNVLRVGSAKGEHDPAYVDIVGSHQHSSNNCGQVAGAALLVRQALLDHWDYTTDVLDLYTRAALLATATPSSGARHGAGMLHVARAVQWATLPANGHSSDESPQGDSRRVVHLKQSRQVTIALVWYNTPTPNANFTKWEQSPPDYRLQVNDRPVNTYRHTSFTCLVVDVALLAGENVIQVLHNSNTPPSAYAMAIWGINDALADDEDDQVTTVPEEVNALEEKDTYGIVRQALAEIASESCDSAGNHEFEDNDCEAIIEAVDRQREAWQNE